MARLKSALFQSGSGSIGNMIFQDYVDGDIIARSKPQEVANPNTSKQRSQRSSFALIQAEASILLFLLRAHFAPTASDRNGYTSYLSKGLNTFKELALDYPSYVMMRQITNGSRPQSPIYDSDADDTSNPGYVTVSKIDWHPLSGSQSIYNSDVGHVIAFDPYTGNYYQFEVDPRAAGSIVPINTGISASKTVFFYLFFIDEATGAVSDSQYVGTWYNGAWTDYETDPGAIEPPLPVTEP